MLFLGARGLDINLTFRYSFGMTLFRRLVARAADRHGYFTVDDALEEGGTRMALVMLAQRGTVERVGRGLYRVAEMASDPLAQYQEALLRLPGAVLSHDTALEVEGLADVNPRRVHVTVARRYRLRKNIPAWVAIHRADLDVAEITEHEGLAIVTPAQAIIDAITDNLGDRFVDQAIATARRRNQLTTDEEKRIKRIRADRHRAQSRERGA